MFDPNAVLYLNQGILPKPNTSDGQASTSATLPIDVVDTVVRVDQKINDKWQVMGHYMHDSVTQSYQLPFLGWLWASYNSVTSTLVNPSNSAAVKLTGTITPTLLLEVAFNYDGNTIDITNSSNSFLPSGWNAKTFFNNGSKSLPSVTGWGNPYGTAEDMGSAPWHNAAQDYSPIVALSYSMGKHATKFGFSYNRYTKNQQIFGSPPGQHQLWHPDQRQHHGYVAGCYEWIQPGATGANQPLRKPDDFGLRDGQLAHDAPLERSVWPPLRCPAARMGAQ